MFTESLNKITFLSRKTCGYIFSDHQPCHPKIWYMNLYDMSTHSASSRACPSWPCVSSTTTTTPCTFFWKQGPYPIQRMDSAARRCTTPLSATMPRGPGFFVIFMRIQISKTSFLTINWECQESILNVDVHSGFAKDDWNFSFWKHWRRTLDFFSIVVDFLNCQICFSEVELEQMMHSPPLFVARTLEIHWFFQTVQRFFLATNSGGSCSYSLGHSGQARFTGTRFGFDCVDAAFGFGAKEVAEVVWTTNHAEKPFLLHWAMIFCASAKKTTRNKVTYDNLHGKWSVFRIF